MLINAAGGADKYIVQMSKYEPYQSLPKAIKNLPLWATFTQIHNK